MKAELWDNARRYGAVSRALHWGMAVLFAWQFLGVILGRLLREEHPVAEWFGGTHGSVGMLILALAVVRVVWALVNRSRPPHDPGPMGRLAKAGHFALYALMVIIPSLALVRAFGSGRGVDFFGIELAVATGVEVEWMTAPASLLHGELAWFLLVLILGHIAMALAHRWLWGDDLLARMGAGREANASG